MMVLDTGPGRSVVNLRLKPYYCRTVYSCTLYLESKRADCFLGCTRMWKRLVVYHPRLPLPCLQLGTVAMARVCKLTALIVLVFATVCASAGACADGSSPGSNGCCAATLECPTCCLLTGKQTSSPTPDASSTTCTCSGCTGESVEINATCVYDDCVARGISAFRFGFANIAPPTTYPPAVHTANSACPIRRPSLPAAMSQPAERCRSPAAV